jgi:hypothetical protein
MELVAAVIRRAPSPAQGGTSGSRRGLTKLGRSPEQPNRVHSRSLARVQRHPRTGSHLRSSPAAGSSRAAPDTARADWRGRPGGGDSGCDRRPAWLVRTLDEKWYILVVRSETAASRSTSLSAAPSRGAPRTRRTHRWRSSSLARLPRSRRPVALAPKAFPPLPCHPRTPRAARPTFRENGASARCARSRRRPSALRTTL